MAAAAHVAPAASQGELRLSASKNEATVTNALPETPALAQPAAASLAKAKGSLAVEDGEAVGYAAVVPLQGWSSHVGEVRVIVDPGHRGRGVGRALARHSVLQAVRLGLTKMVVEVDGKPHTDWTRQLTYKELAR